MENFTLRDRHCLVVGPEFGYICILHFRLKPCERNKLGRVPGLFISKQDCKESVSVCYLLSVYQVPDLFICKQEYKESAPVCYILSIYQYINISNRGTFVECCWPHCSSIRYIFCELLLNDCRGVRYKRHPLLGCFLTLVLKWNTIIEINLLIWNNQTEGDQ